MSEDGVCMGGSQNALSHVAECHRQPEAKAFAEGARFSNNLECRFV